MDTIEHAKKRMRRRHGEELKQQVLAECAVPGASVAAVAMAHDLNANLVHRWRRLAEAGQKTACVSSFVPVMVAPTQVIDEPPQCIDIEVQRGATSVKVRWPMADAASFASWLREILR